MNNQDNHIVDYDQMVRDAINELKNIILQLKERNKELRLERRRTRLQEEKDAITEFIESNEQKIFELRDEIALIRSGDTMLNINNI